MREPVDPNTRIDEDAPHKDSGVERDRGIKFVAGREIYNLAFHCTAKDLWPTEYKQAKPEWLHWMHKYLFDFCRPIRTIADEVRCVACNAQVTGHHALLTDYRVKTALEYEKSGTMEGRCTACGYPARLKHEILDGNGQLLVRLEGFPLFYHPASIKRKTQ